MANAQAPVAPAGASSRAAGARRGTPARRTAAPADAVQTAAAQAAAPNQAATARAAAPNQTAASSRTRAAKRRAAATAHPGSSAGTPGAPRARTNAAGTPAGTAPSAAATAPTAKPRRSRYIPALDGLRTLAVVAVVLYHLNLPWAQGGLLGVTMFFVLSGYLITRLLLAEFRQSGTIDLKDFWLRRVRRLVPAIVTVVLATVILCTIFNHVMLTKMRPDIIPSLLFFNNWWQIFNDVSYFNALGDPSPLTHFWSLAIEEQFYLVWPPVLFVLLRVGSRLANGRGASRGMVLARRVALVLAVVSAAAMTLMYNPAEDPSRLYYGTDTRAFSLLLGACLAFVPEGAMRPVNLLRAVHLDRLIPALAEQPATPAEEPVADAVPAADANAPQVVAPVAVAAAAAQPGSAARRTAARGTNTNTGTANRLVQAGLSVWSADLMGVIGLVGLALMVVFTNGYTSFQYQGGTLLATILTLMVIAACVQQTGMLQRVLSWAPLVWLGKRSYSIYLWHYPLLLLMNPVADVTEKPWWMHIIQAVVIVAAAELSYRFIETPFRTGAVGRFFAQARAKHLGPRAIFRARPVPCVALALALVVAAGGLIFVPDTSALSADGAAVLNANEGAVGTQESPAPAGDAGADANAAAGDAASAAGDDANADGANDADTTSQPVLAGEDGFPAGSYDILMIGDSVSLRAVPEFESTFPHGHIDAAKNRQFAVGQQAYEGYLQQNQAGKIAVFALGTNGLVTDDAIDSLMNDVGSDRIAVFVNTRSPQPWVQATNDAIARAADRYSNVRVIDWYGYSANRNDLFDGDGTHLSSTGAREYIDLIYNAVKDDLPVHPEDHANDPQVTRVRDAATKAATAISELNRTPLGTSTGSAA